MNVTTSTEQRADRRAPEPKIRKLYQGKLEVSLGGESWRGHKDDAQGESYGRADCGCQWSLRLSRLLTNWCLNDSLRACGVSHSRPDGYPRHSGNHYRLWFRFAFAASLLKSFVSREFVSWIHPK
jgi:hypothetical protein